MSAFDRATAAHHTVMARKSLAKIARYLTDCPSDEVARKQAAKEYEQLLRQTTNLGQLLAPQAPRVTPLLSDGVDDNASDDPDFLMEPVARNADAAVVQAASTWGPADCDWEGCTRRGDNPIEPDHKDSLMYCGWHFIDALRELKNASAAGG